MKRLIGGGQSWFYAFDRNGRLLGGSHEDDKMGMALLAVKAALATTAERGSE